MKTLIIILLAVGCGIFIGMFLTKEEVRTVTVVKEVPYVIKPPYGCKLDFSSNTKITAKCITEEPIIDDGKLFDLVQVVEITNPKQ